MEIALFLSTVDGKSISLNTMTERLAEVSPEDWYSLGVQLDVPVRILDGICTDFKGNCEQQEIEILKYWMEYAEGTPDT